MNPEPSTAAARDFFVWLRQADFHTRAVRSTSPEAYRRILAIEAEAATAERQRLGPLPRRRRGFSPMVDGIDYDSSEQ